MIHRARLHSVPLIGNVGLTSADQAARYCLTICFSIQAASRAPKQLDIHLTAEQACYLHEVLGSWIERLNCVGGVWGADSNDPEATVAESPNSMATAAGA